MYVIVPLTILLAFAALAAFMWALRREQFDDLETPAVRVLFDENEVAELNKQANEKRQETLESG